MEVARIMNDKCWIYVVLACAAGAIGERAAGDTITLKSHVRLPAGATSARLADIADLDGPDAASFVDVVIAPIKNTDGDIRLTVQQVRGVLESAGAHWGRINLNGSVVTVRREGATDAAPPRAMTPLSLDGVPTLASDVRQDEWMMATELMACDNVRGVIASMMVNQLRVDPQNLRLRFEPPDAAALERTADGVRFEIQPMGNVAGDRVQLHVRTWRDNVVQASRTITLFPQVRCQVPVCQRSMLKDELISDQDVEVLEQWMSPAQAALCSTRIGAVGRRLNKNLKAGEPLRESCLRRDVLVKRGELTIVRCLVGGVAISLQAEARADGSEGDTIEFRKQGERDTFLGTVVGRSEAVVDLNRRHIRNQEEARP
jgi:flagella basal body P-ring formation protein FlgA